MRSLIISAVLAIGTMAVSCSKSGLETPPVPPCPNATPVEVSLTTAPLESPLTMAPAVKAARASGGGALTVEYGVPDSKSVTSLTSEEERKVNDLWVIQFDKATGALVGEPYYATPEQITRNGTSVNFEAKLTTASTPQVVYFVANTNSPSTFTAANCGTITAMEDVCRRLTAEYRPTAAGGLPMLAAQEYPVIASGTPLTGAVMRRLVAKVVLRCRVSPDFAGFTLTGVRLRNVPTAIWYAAEKSGAVDFPAKNVTYGSESHFDYPAEDLSKAEAEGDFMTFTWYMPENLRKAVATVGDERERVLANTDGMATFIEISGNFKSPIKCERLAYRILLGDAQNDVNDYNVRRNYVYTASVTLEGRNAADKRVTVGTFDMNNSAIVVPNSGDGGAVTFDIRKLTNGWRTTMPALGENAALRAELLWADNAALASQLNIGLDKVNGLLTVKSTGTAEGNAVVALYDNATSGGEVLWSWHIWATPYHPDGGREYGLPANAKADVAGGQVHTYGAQYMAKNLGKVIMDRNLGATKALYKLVTTNAENYPTYGLFYQWGRKDPIPKAPLGTVVDKSTTSQTTYNASGQTTGYPVLTAGPVAVGETVKNPQTFYYNSEGDWNSSRNDALWGDGAPKSPYDPCPKGWRVAPNGTWDDFGATWGSPFSKNADWTTTDVHKAGGLYTAGSVKAFYPAPGGRHADDGKLYYVGFRGYSWASTINSTNAYYIAFNCSGGIGAHNSYYRAYGFQVRCIQE